MTRYTDKPFPPYKHRPGHTPHPERDRDGYRFGKTVTAPTVPSEDDWHRNADYLYGVDLFNSGYYWEAHAVWEELWRVALPSCRSSLFLQGLIQLAASLLKRSFGRKAGASKLLEAALDKLERVASESPSYMGVEIPQLLSKALRPGKRLRIELEPPLASPVLYSRKT